MSFEEWEVVNLGDVANVLSGYAFKSKDFTQKGVPVIKIKNIVPPYVALDDIQYISNELAEEKQRYELKYNDVLISLTGSNVNQFASAVGKIGRVKLKNQRLMLNQRVGKFEILDNKKFDLNFLYYLVSTDEMRYKLASNAGGGANQANISPSLIKKIILPCPPLQEQNAIANTLSCLDDKIELNNRITQTLEEIAQAIFQSWFVDFEPFQDGVFADSELGKIPEGWKVDVIDNVVSLIIDHRGKTPKKLGSDWSDKGIIALSAKSIKNGELVNLNKANYVDENLYRKWMKDELKCGDVLMTSEAPLGELHYIVSNKKYCLSQRLYAIRADEEVIKPSLLYYELMSNRTQYQIQARGSGSTVIGIRQSELRRVPMLIPSKEWQEKFSLLADKLLEKKDEIASENQILNHLRDTLLPKFMSGEIRIPNDNSRLEVI